eukprot:TRINITY_DN4810_c0_g1_i1.p1 TRINITY_DN4810_c0_g1~~TRINITY_DN4810_c0_g1_i1.p1  ORF type:complete len:352 (+),score=57.20 TRINITY_DN4810_c0_g1_i1:33-1058(+)
MYAFISLAPRVLSAWPSSQFVPPCAKVSKRPWHLSAKAACRVLLTATAASAAFAGLRCRSGCRPCAQIRRRRTATHAVSAEIQQRLESLRSMRLRDLKRELEALGCRTDGCVDKESLLELLETQGAAALMQRAKGVAAPSPSGGAAPTKNPIATFETSLGVFKAEIFLLEMPLTASNFISLAKEGFYNGIHFHRVIPNFMAQFGCPNARDPQSPLAGTGGPEDGSEFRCVGGNYDGKNIMRINGGCIPDEFTCRISNAQRTLSMANTGSPNSGGSQFFINVGDNDQLDWFNTKTDSKHPVFGKIVQGYEVVVNISRTPTKQDRPITPVVMKSITIREGMSA